MEKYKKILLAFDGSISSKNALIQSKKFIVDEGASLDVISVAPRYDGDLDIIGIHDISRAQKEQAKKLLDEARTIAAENGFEIRTILETGDIYQKIVETAERENSELIVMGRRGFTRLERVLLGSVSAKVVGHTNKDTLVVPKDSQIGWDKILLATDNSGYSKAAADAAYRYACAYGGRLTILSVVDIGVDFSEEFIAMQQQFVEETVEKTKESLIQMKAKMEKPDSPIDIAVKQGTTYEKIVETANELGSNIIFMGSHGWTGLTKLLMGSVTEKVIGHSDCPVMVVKKQ